MNRILVFFVSAAALLFSGCSPVETETGNSNLLSSFRLMVDGVLHHGVIDHSSGTVTFAGIRYGNSVEDVEYRLAEGATITPDPETLVGDWPESCVFTVSKDGESAEYTVILSDWQTSRKGKAVLSYAVLWDIESVLEKTSWEDITHILPAFVWVKQDGTIDHSHLDRYLDRIKAAAAPHDVKIVPSFMSNTTNGSGIAGEFGTAVSTPESRERLATAMVDYVRENDLAGIDIDYEEYDVIATDKGLDNILALFRLLREKMDPDMIMTCSIAGAWLDYSTEWHEYFDYVSIMSYDYVGDKPVQHSSYDNFLRDISHAHEEDGMPLSKICPGIPFYGHTWDRELLKDLNQESRLHYTVAYHKILSYYGPTYPGVDLCERDQIGDTFYNGKPLIRQKCRYVMENGLGGLMIWQLAHDSDDDKNALLPVIGEGLKIKR